MLERTCNFCRETYPLTAEFFYIRRNGSTGGFRMICVECELKQVKLRRQKLKEECLAAYGGAICITCNYSDIRALTISHTKGDGAAHRRELFGDSRTGGGHQFYYKLKKQGFPKDLGLVVECFNCNILRNFDDYAPSGNNNTKEGFNPDSLVLSIPEGILL